MQTAAAAAPGAVEVLPPMESEEVVSE